MLFRVPVAILSLLIAATTATAQEKPIENKLTGREVAILVDQRPDGDDRSSELTFTLINKQGKRRIRKVKSYQKDIASDTKSLMCFLSPADVKNTIFLQHEYDDPCKEDDKWLYLPALKKARRIAGSSKNDYFMGTDFTYDDMGDRNVDEDEHSLLQDETIDGHCCWVKESKPKDRNYMYSKVISWIRKDIYIPIKIDFYDRHGELLKSMVLSDFRNTDGFWKAFKLEMENFQQKHKTIIEYQNVKYNSNLEDNLFEVSSIERGRIR